MSEGQIITTPNGKRWWQEVWSKVVAGLLLLVLGGMVTGAWVKAGEAVAATVEVYALPPQVRKLRTDVDELKAKPEMAPQTMKDLAKAIADEMRKTEGKKR